MKKIALVSMFLALALSTASAGYRSDSVVTIVTNPDGSKIVRGALGSVANSANTVEYIGCSLRFVVGATETYCYAKNAAGEQVQCRTTLEYVANVVQSINSDSYVTFLASASGNCNQVEIFTASNHRVKQN